MLRKGFWLRSPSTRFAGCRPTSQYNSASGTSIGQTGPPGMLKKCGSPKGGGGCGFMVSEYGPPRACLRSRGAHRDTTDHMQSIPSWLGLCLVAAVASAQTQPLLSEDTVPVSPHVWAILGFPNIGFVVGTKAQWRHGGASGPQAGPQ
jgi:hypothetical protein